MATQNKQLRNHMRAIMFVLGCVVFGDITRGIAKDKESLPSPRFESYSVILMLDQGPVHTRFAIAMQGRPISEQRNDFYKDLIERLDLNGDSRLTLDEADKSYLLRQKSRTGTARFLKYRNLTSKQLKSFDEVVRMVKRVAGRSVVFRQNDVAAESDEFIFGLLDGDGSGVIDTVEMESAAERLFKLDTDNDECIGFDEVQPPPEEPVDPLNSVLRLEQTQNERSHAVFSEILRLADEPSLPQRLMRRYDQNKNGKLSPKELHWEKSRIRQIDKNGDGELARSELKNIGRTLLDIDLTVDIAPADAGRPELHILHCRGKRFDRVARPGIAKLLLQDTTVTISYRHVDPISDALDNSRRKFNILDGDANGYLDRSEVEGEILLQQGLFAQIDADGDDRIFTEEMDAYVTERAIPKSMSCRVNIYDTGSGLFQTMDHNNDGRISAREMKTVANSLSELNRDDTPGVTKGEPAGHFHIEFVRGTFQLFGPSEQAAKQTVSFNTQIAVGPPWFVGSDRNNDGDLTWNEFLGHREDFHFLDVDRDGFIDPVEAKRAEQLRHE